VPNTVQSLCQIAEVGMAKRKIRPVVAEQTAAVRDRLRVRVDGHDVAHWAYSLEECPSCATTACGAVYDGQARPKREQVERLRQEHGLVGNILCGLVCCHM